jgi:hypothetical protein
MERKTVMETVTKKIEYGKVSLSREVDNPMIEKEKDKKKKYLKNVVDLKEDEIDFEKAKE